MNARLKAAEASSKTLIKMREDFINNYLKNHTDSDGVPEFVIDSIKKMLRTTYNEGAADAITILTVSSMSMMEGGLTDD